jgi:hypothetical protein
MLVFAEQKVIIPKGILIQELDGEMVLLNASKGEYFGLDAMGHQFWLALVEGESIGEAAQRLMEEYEVEPDRLELDLSALVQTLTDHGLLEIVAPSA